MIIVKLCSSKQGAVVLLSLGVHFDLLETYFFFSFLLLSFFFSLPCSCRAGVYSVAVVSLAGLVYWSEIFTPGVVVNMKSARRLGEYSARNHLGETISLSKYVGQVVLVVNVASE